MEVENTVCGGGAGTPCIIAPQCQSYNMTSTSLFQPGVRHQQQQTMMDIMRLCTSIIVCDAGNTLSLCVIHANLSPTTRNWPFSVLGFWDKNTWICAGAMPYRRDFTATTRI